MDPLGDLGYIADRKILIFANDDFDFGKYLGSIKTYYPDQIIDIISKKDTPERWKSEIAERMHFFKAVQVYDRCMYRDNDILNYTKYGKCMVEKVFPRYSNVHLKTNADVVGYDIDPKSKRVRSVQTASGETIPCDIVVNCMGPQAPSHLYQHFGVVVPIIGG